MEQNRKYYILHLICEAFALIIVIVLGVVFNDDNSNTDSPTMSPTPNNTYFSTINEAVSPLYPPNSESPLLIPSTPQSDAYQWIAYNDTMSNSQNMVQRFSIAVLYFSLVGKEWYDSENWLSEQSVCNWFGISCDSVALGNVESIMLMGNKLGGSLPAEISLINNLNTLNLTDNKIGGSIPSAIGMLNTSLSYLSLKMNHFGGTIPTSIGSLSYLKYLILSYNYLEGTISSHAWKLNNLVGLSLESNGFTGQVPVTFDSLASLRVFKISNNDFTGNFPYSNMSQMDNMKNFEIRNNSFIGTIADLEMPNLRTIQMDQNGYEGCIPKSFFNFKYLEYLSFNNNELSCELFPEMYNGKELSELRLQYNKFNGPLPKPNGYSPLVYLKLNDNSFNGTIPSELGDLINIEQLLLHENSLYGDMPASLCDLQKSNSAQITSDCSGDDALVNCSCCYNCAVTSPQ